MRRMLAIAALAATALSGCTRSAWEAEAQQVTKDTQPDAATLRFLLASADVVGFQSTGTGAQVLYHVEGLSGGLVLCSWKLQPKPSGSGCVALPAQP